MTNAGNDDKAKNLFDLFSCACGEYADRVAVVEDTGVRRSSLTYSQLWASMNSVAEALASFLDSSTCRSSFVAVTLEQSLVFPAVILAILSHGMGFACIDCTWSREKQNSFLEKLNASILISTRGEPQHDDQQHMIEVVGQKIILKRLRRSSIVENEINVAVSYAYAVSTSGSTGEPKIVFVPHSSIIPNVIDIRKVCNISEHDTVFLASPSTFDPSIVDIFSALSCGATLLVTTHAVKTSPTSLLRVLFPSTLEEGATVLQITPSVFSRWSLEDIQSRVLGKNTSLRVLIFGGEPCPSLRTLSDWKGRNNQTAIYNIYGITEVSSWASIQHIRFPSDAIESRVDPIELGEALSETYLQVRHLQTGQLIEDGVGEMFIGSSSRICIINDEDASSLLPPVFRATGDIVKVENGRFFYVGRKNRTIKRFGHRVSLENVEQVALDHPSVKAAYCVWDEKIHRLSLCVTGLTELDSPLLQKHFLSRTAEGLSSSIPDEIHFFDQLPITCHGKIDKQALVENIQGKKTSRGAQNSSLSMSSELICEKFHAVWSKTLGLDCRTESEQSFVSLGGNSLLAVQMSTVLEEDLGSVPPDLVDLLVRDCNFKMCCDRLIQFYTSYLSVINEQESSSSSKFRESKQVESSPRSAVKGWSLHEKDPLSYACAQGKYVFGSVTSPYNAVGQLEGMSIRLTWSVDLGKCIDASPLCLVYESGCVKVAVGSHSGKVAVLNGLTGKTEVMCVLPDRVESTAYPSPCGEFVFIGCYDGCMYCINVVTGDIKWSFKTGAMIKCRASLCNQNKSVIFGSYDQYIYCLNAEAGTMEWKSNVSTGRPGSWLACPLVAGDKAIVCSLSGCIAALKTDDGSATWVSSLGSPIFSSPVLLPSSSESPTTVIAEVQGVLHGLHICSGKEVWQWKAAGNIFSSPSVVPRTQCLNDASLILFGCQDSFLYCLSVQQNVNVTLHWKVSLMSPVVSSPFCFQAWIEEEEQNLLTAVNTKGTVFVIKTREGVLVSQLSLASEVYSSPCIHRGAVYVGCRDNRVYGLDLQMRIPS